MGILRAALYLSLLGSAGCAQLFGIDTTSSNDAGVPVDASPTSVTMQVQRLSEGPSPTRSAYDVSTLPANFLVSDSSAMGFHRVASIAAGDTWSAEIPDGTPAMEVTLGLDIPDQFRRLYALPQRNIKLLYGIYEQAGAVPAPAAGTITATLNLSTPASAPVMAPPVESYQLYCVGSWARYGLPFTDGVASITQAMIPFNNANWGNISGRPFTKITALDTMLGLKWSATGQLLAAAEFPAFEQTAGDVVITASMTNVTATAMDVHTSPSTIGSRLAMPTPAATSAVAIGWSTNASPGWEIANAAGPQLAAGSLLTTDSGALTAPFGNPFASKGWKTTFSYNSNKSRQYAVPQLGNLPATFYTGINSIYELSAGLTVEPAAALPVLVSINSKPMTTDGLTVTIDPAKAVTLTMVTDYTMPAPTFYQYNIYELRENAASTLEAHVAYVVVSDKPTTSIPSDAFTAGKTYWVRAHTINGGYPSFAAGNFWDRNLPYSVGYLDSGLFTAAAP